MRKCTGADEKKETKRWHADIFNEKGREEKGKYMMTITNG
jgi:hypothetical protein